MNFPRSGGNEAKAHLSLARSGSSPRTSLEEFHLAEPFAHGPVEVAQANILAETEESVRVRSPRRGQVRRATRRKASRSCSASRALAAGQPALRCRPGSCRNLLDAPPPGGLSHHEQWVAGFSLRHNDWRLSLQLRQEPRLDLQLVGRLRKAEDEHIAGHAPRTSKLHSPQRPAPVGSDEHGAGEGGDAALGHGGRTGHPLNTHPGRLSCRKRALDLLGGSEDADAKRTRHRTHGEEALEGAPAHDAR